MFSEMAAFGRDRRLQHAAEFELIFHKAKRFQQHGFKAYFYPSTHTNSRLGLAIAKKQIAGAVDRNRIKRFIRESFRKQTIEGLDVIVSVSQQVLQLNNQQMHQCLEQLWQRVINESSK